MKVLSSFPQILISTNQLVPQPESDSSSADDPAMQRSPPIKQLFHEESSQSDTSSQLLSFH